MDRKEVFFDEFRCIGGKCSITCCKEWKISVDEATETKWSSISDTKGRRQLSDYIVDKEEQRVIGLDENKQCPFLDNNKLCSLVLEHGDGILSHTCDIFPRQINDYGIYKEYSLVAGCPEVVDMLRDINQVDFTGHADNSLTAVRDFILELIQNKAFSLNKALMMSFYILLEIKEKKSLDIKDYSETIYLNRLSTIIDGMEFNREYTFEECNELYLDITFNYVEQGIYRDFLNRTVGGARQYSDRPWNMDVSILKNYSELIRNCIASEIISTLYLADYDLDNMIVAFQWIVMEYSALRQSILLLDHAEQVNYEKVRECIVYVTRMTGYDEEDIYQYMSDSFENVIWDWGYLALITGIE